MPTGHPGFQREVGVPAHDQVHTGYCTHDIDRPAGDLPVREASYRPPSRSSTTIARVPALANSRAYRSTAAASSRNSSPSVAAGPLSRG